MSERLSESSDEVLGRRLAAELPRHRAPGRLRAVVLEAVEPRRRRGAWLPPTVSALATALVLVLGFVPLLPRIPPVDPAERLVRAVVAEHTRAALWGARRAETLPGGLPWLAQQSGISLREAFAGDERLAFVGAEPVLLDERRGLALYYRDRDGHLLTYIVLPAPSLKMPDRGRVQIARWRPALVRADGAAAWLWKHGELASVLVAELAAPEGLDDFKDYFARVRGATEPVLAN